MPAFGTEARNGTAWHDQLAGQGVARGMRPGIISYKFRPYAEGNFPGGKKPEKKYYFTKGKNLSLIVVPYGCAPQAKLTRKYIDGKQVWIWAGLSLNRGKASQLAKVGGEIQLSKKPQIIHEEEAEATSTNRLKKPTWLDKNREAEE